MVLLSNGHSRLVTPTFLPVKRVSPALSRLSDSSPESASKRSGARFASASRPTLFDTRARRAWASLANLEAFKLLVEEFKADVQNRSGDGMTPLQTAQRSGSRAAAVVEYLERREAQATG